MGYQAIYELEQAFDNLIFKGKQVGATPQIQIAAGKKWAQAVWDQATKEGGLAYAPAIIEQGLELSQEAVFLCGVERSGTTLLRNLLDNHTQLSVLPSEGTYYTNLEAKMKTLSTENGMQFLCCEWLWRLVTSAHQPPFWLLGRSTETASPYVAFARSFQTWWHLLEEKKSDHPSWPYLVLQLAFSNLPQHSIKGQQLRLWVDKTPKNEFYLDRIWSEFPKAKIIYIARNPLAIINSRKRMDGFVGTPTRYFIKDLRKSWKVLDRQLNNKDARFFFLQYETLVTEPANSLQKVADFLGVRFEPNMLVPTTMGQLTKSNSSFTEPEQAGRILATKTKQESFDLNQSELHLLTAAVGRQANQLGYEMPVMSGIGAFWTRLKNRMP